MKINTWISVTAIAVTAAPSVSAMPLCAKAARPAWVRLAARIETRIENKLDGNSWYIASMFRKWAQTRDEQGEYLLTVGEINSALMRSLTAFEYLRLIPKNDLDDHALLPFGSTSADWGLGFQPGKTHPLEAADFISLLEVIPPYAKGEDPERPLQADSRFHARQRLGFELRKLTNALKCEELSQDARELLLDAERAAVDKDARQLRETLALILLETRDLIEARAEAPTPLRVQFLRNDNGAVPIHSEDLPRERFFPPAHTFRSTDVYGASLVQRNGATNGHDVETNGHGRRP